MRLILGLILGCSVFAGCRNVPAGAAALGYTTCVIDEKPQVGDIAPGKTGAYKWFSGQWYARELPPQDSYFMTNGVLAMKQGGDLISVQRDMRPGGLLPVLPGKNGFYVEFEVSLSGNDPDYFPAVWLMPIEKNGRKEAKGPQDPQGFERYMELDVDEGGFGPGLTGTVHSWWGEWPKYGHIQSKNNVSKIPLDRTQKHVFGASYNPATGKTAWWVDGVFQMEADAPYVPEVGSLHNYYLIMGAQSHKFKKPYIMYIHSVRAFVPAK